MTDSFYDYAYCEDDAGLKSFFKSRDDMYTYISAIVKASYKSGLVYATSENHEGFMVLSGEGSGDP